MSAWAGLRLWLRARLRRGRVEREIEEELRFHIALERRKLVRSGLEPPAAQAEAERRFGDFAAIRRQCRKLYMLPAASASPSPPGAKGNLDMLLQDLRYALRALSHRPAIAAVAVVTLTLGIGANVAIFSVVHAVLWRALPVPDPDRIVVGQMYQSETGRSMSSVTYPDYLDWRQQIDVFEGVAALRNRSFDLTGDGEPERLRGLEVSEDYFDLLRAEPVLGRTLEPADFAPDAEKAVVLGQGLWQRRFGGRRDVAGTPLRLAGRTYTVVGVVDSERLLPTSVEIFAPLDFGHPKPDWLMRRDNYFLQAFARLADGVSFEQAEARMAVLSRRIAEAEPENRAGIESRIITVRQRLVRPELRLALMILLAAVGLVLAVACFNVANLLLTQALERRHEMAVRLALGAGQARLARQLLVESLVLAAVSCAAGLAVGHWGLRALLARVPSGLPLPEDIGLNPPVLVFGLAVAVGTALVFGLVPVWQTTRKGLNAFLRVASTGGAAGSARMRSGLVVAEVALSLLLLVMAGLLLRSFARVSTSDPGLALRERLALSVRLPDSRYPGKEQVDRFYGAVLERVGRLPGVRSVAATSWLPVGGGGVELSRSHLLEGMPEPPAGPEYLAAWNVVTPDYFKTSGIRLLAGRDFDSAVDHDGSTPVMMINRAFADQLFPDTNPIGQRVRSWRDENVLREVVGVVDNVRLEGLGDEWRPIVYVPARQTAWPPLQALLVETEGDPMALADAVRAEVWALDDELPLSGVRSLEELAAGSLGRERFVALLLGSFALVALALAAVGVYGLVSCSVSQRTREIGVRMALGAVGGDILAMVVRQGLRLAMVGVVLGLGVAFAASRALEALLFEVSAGDPPTYLAVALILGSVALVASLVPALRATRVDPLRVLRYE